METVFTLIGSYGFPIVMCLLLFKQIQLNDTRHKEEIDQLRQAIDNNTKVVVKLIDKVEEMS